MPSLTGLTKSFAARCDGLSFGAPVTHVYNPLAYAAAPHAEYLRRYAQGRKRALFVGMNPGPWGMAQSGIPFGDVECVRGWLKIEAKVGRPGQLHPRRPVHGFACQRREVSGQRLWGLFQGQFGTASKFFRRHTVLNYCPLLFSRVSDKSCVNITPDKLAAPERRQLYQACDGFLRAAVEEHLEPEHIVAIGNFAEARLRRLFPERKIVRMLHPSPASPAANRGFAESAAQTLKKAGIW